MSPRWCALLCAVLMYGCAAAVPSGGSGATSAAEAETTSGDSGGPLDASDGESELLEIERLTAELTARLPGSTTDGVFAAPAPLSEPAAAPDCPGAAVLRDRICELSAHICRLAAQRPADSAIEERCQRARATCEQARRDVEQACGGG